MSSLVKLDDKGPFGPAVTLLYNYKYLNKTGISEVAGLLKINYIKVAKVKPKGKREFCANEIKTPLEIIGTRFFQAMQRESPNHDKILQFMVPRMLKNVDITETDSRVNDWLARFIASYLSEEQIIKHCNVQSTVGELINQERMSIGTELYLAKPSEKELDAIIGSCRAALNNLKHTDNFDKNLMFTGRYLALFAMKKDNPMLLADDVLELLTTKFREKMFPKNQDKP